MQDIYSFVKAEENRFQTDEIQLGDNWFWNFRNHVQLLFHLKNGVFFTGVNDMLRAFKNVMLPILSLCYWTEDIEVKDVVFYTEEEEDKVLSFLIKKYHDEVYAREHDLNTLFDEITESDLDYGGVLVQKGVEIPEILTLNSIAFCDQTDVLGGAIGFKQYYTSNKLRSMSKFGWGEEKNGATISLEDLCTLAGKTKDSASLSKKPNKIPSKTIEIYVVRGSMPESYLKEGGDSETYCNQLQIIGFYTKEDGKAEGVTLYRKEEDEGNLKFFTSKKIYQRALGQGVGETLIHPQIWTNFLNIHKIGMLESASKIPLYTDDPAYTTKNKIQDMENLEITTIEDGKKIYQVPTAAPANIQLMDETMKELFNDAQFAGAAFDPLLGKAPASGTTFRGQERTVAQGQGQHQRRMGQRAKFIEEIYRDWIIPDIVSEILKGKKFMANLSFDELSWISNRMAINLANEKIKNMILNGRPISQEEQQQIQQTIQQSILKSGNKKMIEILKDDFKDVEMKVGVSVANKQKDMGVLVDRMDTIMKEIMSNPYMLKTEPIIKLFNARIEAMGLDPIDFSNFQPPMPMPMRRVTESIDYADLQPPAQQAMLQGAGINVQTPVQQPQQAPQK